MLAYYFVLILIIIITIRFFYIHIKYPFWSHMSVYHTYDYHYLLSAGNRKIQMFPCKNKYTNPLQIKTINFYDLNDTYTKYFVELLQCFYIPDDSILFTILEKDAKSIFSGHFAAPYISFYNEKNIVSTSARTQNSLKPFDALSTNMEIGLFPDPKGCIGSYPVRVFFHPKGHAFEANYFTFVATDRSYDNQHIARHLIATHDFNCRRHNPDIDAGILKKDIGTCDGVVPFFEFTTYAIRMVKPKRTVRNIVQVYRQNWDAMFDTLSAVSSPSNSLFDFVVTVDLGAIKARIDGGLWFVFAYCDQGNVLAMYFLENANMLYEKTSAKTLRLVASINNGLSADMFQQGLADCLRKLIKQNLDYKILLIDNIGHNSQVIIPPNQLMAETTGAYYFINWLFVDRIVRDRAFLLT